jgi:hypothetical protein
MLASADGKLLSWEAIRSKDWTGILLGNGASIAVWDRFSYPTLLDVASGPAIKHPLSKKDLRLFETLDTRQFELVLFALGLARKVNGIFQLKTRPLKKAYDLIKRALIEAVHSVHIRWADTPVEVLMKIHDELRKYKFVFSTNYDLITYWAIMAHEGAGFTDYFFSGAFDPGNTEVWDEAVTRVLYLHGGLHLYRRQTGGTLKRRASGMNLLDVFGQPYYDADPLFVAEGASADKLSVITGSDYLTFAFNTFGNHSGPLVVFGHSLGQTDKHIIDVMQRWGKREIAISLLPNDRENLRRAQASLIEKLPGAQLYFFDATTHPLGSKDLKVHIEQ